MKDELGREVKVGDYIAHYVRYGSSVDWKSGVIRSFEVVVDPWTDRETTKARVVWDWAKHPYNLPKSSTLVQKNFILIEVE